MDVFLLHYPFCLQSWANNQCPHQQLTREFCSSALGEESLPLIGLNLLLTSLVWWLLGVFGRGSDRYPVFLPGHFWFCRLFWYLFHYLGHLQPKQNSYCQVALIQRLPTPFIFTVDCVHLFSNPAIAFFAVKLYREVGKEQFEKCMAVA